MANYFQDMFSHFFGYKHKEEKTKDTPNKIESFSMPENDEGTLDIAAGVGFFQSQYNGNPEIKNEKEIINQYRGTAQQPELDFGIEEIVNEAVVAEEEDKIVKINLENVKKVGEGTKKKIIEEFEEVYNMLNFDFNGYELFKKWYIDGRLYIHKKIDKSKKKDGIQEFEYLDPRKIKKVREIYTKKNDRGVDVVDKIHEYFIYDEQGINDNNPNSTQIKIAKDSITYITSGILSADKKFILSHLHKALKPLNQLRQIEDALVIFTVSRAPERRVFYIDVGNLPTKKAEEYLHKVMNKYKNKLVYDSSTGEIRDDRKFNTMLEDFWLPRREGGKGTEIDTLQSQNQLVDSAYIEYFQRKLYKSLNVPFSRVIQANETTFNIGRSNEITRDEVKFSKFISRLRRRFSMMFDDVMKTQLILKNIISSVEEWEEISKNIYYVWASDSFFSEIKEFEVLREKISLAQEMDILIEKGFYSKEWVRKNVLKQSEEDIKEIDKQIESEREKEPPPEGEEGLPQQQVEPTGFQPGIQTPQDLENPSKQVTEPTEQ